MASKFTLIVTSEGKETEITCQYADIVALEEKFNIDAAELKTRARAGWLSFLAWHALFRTKQTDLPYDEWINLLDEVDSKATKEGGSGEA